jgi:hypothetical protein
MWNRFMTRRFPGTSYLFDIGTLAPTLDRRAIPGKLAYATHCAVEVMTHPEYAKQSSFLLSDCWEQLIAPYRRGTYGDLHRTSPPLELSEWTR